VWKSTYKTNLICTGIHHISQPIRCTVIFSLEILEKNNDEHILISVIILEENRIVTYQN